MPQAPRQWKLEVFEALADFGLHPSNADECCLVNQNRTSALVIIVDDMLIAGNEVECERIVSALKSKYRIKVKDSPDVFVGLELKRDRQSRTIEVTQQRYAMAIVKRALENGDKVKGTYIPIPVGTRYTRPEEDELRANSKEYQHLIGSLCSSCWDRGLT